MIGYYVHHHGSGHRQRALAVAAELGADLTLLGSLGPPDEVPSPYLELPRDDIPAPAGDVTAGGLLHWAPLRHAGLRARHGMLADWLARTDPRLLVSDVSVEVLLLARLLSVPPVAVALRGARSDRAHAAGYDAAVAILAPWPRATQHEWPARWLAKTRWVGMISRYDGRPRVPLRCELPGRCVVLVLGRGGHHLDAADLAEAAAVTDAHWHLLGAVGHLALPVSGCVVRHGEVADPWPFLCRADVVVAAAGDATIADVAAARAPLVAVPQPRPFDEQAAHVGILADHGLCIAAESWPDRRSWPGLLDRAAALGGRGWTEQVDGLGACRAAAFLAELAADRQIVPAGV